MASNGTTIEQLAATLSARSKTLINNDLKRICKEEGQNVGGNKSQLQGRVLNMIHNAALGGDFDTLQRLRYRLHNHGEAPPPTYNAPAAPPAQASPAPPNRYPSMATGQNGYASRQSYPPYRPPPALPPTSSFKESPFYEIRELLLGGMSLEVSPNHRLTLNKTLILSTEQCNRLKSDPTLRVLLFAAVDQPLGPYQRVDVAFPSQVEVKINGDEIKANYKGLKGKPGSTRPADITDYVRKVAHYRNSLLVTYALTQKVSHKEKYNIYLYMVKKHTVEDLAQRITLRNVITKQTVINEMLKKANDADIVVSSTNMSLKDPISTLRITIPCRSNLCNHNQCFDAASFLQLQEQAPTWQCPVCNKTVSFEGLAVDQYVQEILDSVPKGTDQVTIEPNGDWSNGNKTEPQPYRNGSTAAHEDNSDDELVEIPDYRVSAIKSEAIYTPLSMAQTTPLSSREASTAPRTGQKRTSEVIDLTLSDDDEPSRPAKKVAYHTPSSLPDPSRRYQMPSFGVSSAPIRPQAPSLNHNNMPSSLRLDLSAPSPTLPPYGAYRPPLPRSAYPDQGLGTYPNYGNSP
ncbi:uncharacterized protein BDR25DRAFT_244893 [Lindgomyces ingoldianus]|uniref:Uncharacterized protein n=1 Tax=Lindgomyces ingoldianus TaxID=673940 RepID=A0ACB6QA20_9PLEO|nr:uncharacterized protein BDR25DRAFT_244893 [Lindgomyces ingoldianus]KAF2463751.1 hypothetical protein BDR25DRAFT_244893 [Lindgomyces ingoldianus]